MRAFIILVLLSVLTSTQVCVAQNAGPSKVLVILSGADYVEVSKDVSDRSTLLKHPTGYYLNELMVPTLSFLNAGMEVEFATPLGLPAMSDINSMAARYFKSETEFQEAKAWRDSQLQIAKPELGSFGKPYPFNSIQEEQLAKFDLIFIPGGHAPMQDLYRDQELGRILRYFVNKGKLISAICHGPAALLSLTPAYANTPWGLSNFRMTGFSNEEEHYAETPDRLGGFLKFHLEDALKNAGGLTDMGTKFKSHVVRDRNLVTGQNPQSDTELSALVLTIIALRELKNARATSNWDGKPLNEESSNIALKILQKNPAWESGFTTVFIGKKQNGLSENAFWPQLGNHIDQVTKSFANSGLQNYWAWSDGNIEIAFQNWTDEKNATAAFSTPEGQAIVQGASKIFEAKSLFSAIKDRECLVALNNLAR
ncbi:MAG: thiamine biosynthesis protein ThiJ [Bacteriovoracaceae bacterium]|nr:thiamine biosynthesis protein ThiJ [Bacteriovoracaceae bacterium]